MSDMEIIARILDAYKIIWGAIIALVILGTVDRILYGTPFDNRLRPRRRPLRRRWHDWLKRQREAWDDALKMGGWK